MMAYRRQTYGIMNKELFPVPNVLVLFSIRSFFFIRLKSYQRQSHQNSEDLSSEFTINNYKHSDPA